MKRNLFRQVLPACLFALLLLIPACRSTPQDVAGTYAAPNPATGKPPFTLTLGKDGKGSLACDFEDAKISWESRPDGEIWLHTKTGGVISGRVEGETLLLNLPGSGTLSFKKSEDEPKF